MFGTLLVVFALLVCVLSNGARANEQFVGKVKEMQARIGKSIRTGKSVEANSKNVHAQAKVRLLHQCLMNFMVFNFFPFCFL